MVDYSVTSGNHTIKTTAAGRIDLIIGSLSIIGSLVIVFGLFLFAVNGSHMFGIPTNIGLLILLAGIPLLTMGILSIIGGIHNLGRKNWGWALAGSIATALVTIWGVAAVILTVISKDEFEQ